MSAITVEVLCRVCTILWIFYWENEALQWRVQWDTRWPWWIVQRIGRWCPIVYIDNEYSCNMKLGRNFPFYVSSTLWLDLTVLQESLAEAFLIRRCTSNLNWSQDFKCMCVCVIEQLKLTWAYCTKKITSLWFDPWKVIIIYFLLLLLCFSSFVYSLALDIWATWRRW